MTKFNSQFSFGRIVLVVCSAVLAFSASACKTTRSSTQSSSSDYQYQPKVPQPQVVASIAHIDSASGFVLLQTSAGYNPPVGQELKVVQGGKVKATVVVSADRKRPFVVADILSGKPLVGANVLLYPGTPRPSAPLPDASLPDASLSEDDVPETDISETETSEAETSGLDMFETDASETDASETDASEDDSSEIDPSGSDF